MRNSMEAISLYSIAMDQSLTLPWSISFYDCKMRSLDQIKWKVPANPRNCNSELHNSCWYYFYLWDMLILSTEMLFLSLVFSFWDVEYPRICSESGQSYNLVLQIEGTFTFTQSVWMSGNPYKVKCPMLRGT